MRRQAGGSSICQALRPGKSPGLRILGRSLYLDGYSPSEAAGADSIKTDCRAKRRSGRANRVLGDLRRRGFPTAASEVGSFGFGPANLSERAGALPVGAWNQTSARQRVFGLQARLGGRALFKALRGYACSNVEVGVTRL